MTGKSWGLFDSIDDWFADTNTADAPIEVQTGNIAGLAANDGNAKLELDSAASNGYSQSNSAVAQIVDGFVDGQSYTLSFYHSARKKNSSTNQFGVSLNGTLLGEVFNDDKGWQQTTIEFVASLSNGYDANDPGNWDVTVDTGSNGYPQDGDGNLVVALEGDSNGYPSDGNGDVNSGGEGSGESGDNLYPQDTN